MTLKQRVSELKDALIGKLNSLKTNIDTRVLRTTKVIAGTGLSGGGDLTTSRTFAVKYGQTAGTAVEGNDPRVNNGQTAFDWGDHSLIGYLKTYVDTKYTAGTGLTLNNTVFSLPVAQAGSGNYVSAVAQSTGGITVTKATLPTPALVTSTTAAGATNVATTNTNTFLNVTQGGASPGSSTQVTGTGSVSVASDANGKLTITGANTTYALTTLPILTTGTETTGKLISAKLLNDWIDTKSLPLINLINSNTSVGTVNVATTNTNTFLNIVQNGYAEGSSIQVTGTGATTVSTDDSGKLIISSTNTNTTYTVGTLTELNTGADTTGKLQSAKLLNAWINAKGFASYYNSISASSLSDFNITSINVYGRVYHAGTPSPTDGFGTNKWGSALYMGSKSSDHGYGNYIGFDIDGNLYTKLKANDAWGSWKKILTESEITTLIGNSYSVGTKAILDTGTSGANSVYSPLTLNQWLKGKTTYYGFGLSSMDSGFIPTNLNTIMNTSILGFNAPSNAPYAYGSVWTHRRNSGECNQIVIDTLSDSISFRRQQSGVFSPWREIYHSGNSNFLNIEETHDFNNTRGFKILKGSTSNAQNTPLGSWSNGIQFEAAENSQYFNQLIFDIQGRLFTRTKSANVIGEYKEIMTKQTDFGYTSLSTPGLDGMTPFTTKILRFKIHNGNYIIDGEFTCNGTGSSGTSANVIISAVLPRIDPETIETIKLDNYIGTESLCFTSIRLEKTGTQVFLRANLRLNISGTTKFRATLPIASAS